MMGPVSGIGQNIEIMFGAMRCISQRLLANAERWLFS